MLPISTSMLCWVSGESLPTTIPIKLSSLLLISGKASPCSPATGPSVFIRVSKNCYYCPSRNEILASERMFCSYRNSHASSCLRNVSLAWLGGAQPPSVSCCVPKKSGMPGVRGEPWARLPPSWPPFLVRIPDGKVSHPWVGLVVASAAVPSCMCFPSPMSCLFCLLLTIPAPPSLAESRECCLVLLGLQAFNLLKCWRSGERVEGLTDVTGGPGVWGLPEMPAENMHACKGTNAAGLQRFLSSRAWSLSSILRKMTAPWCDSLWGLTKSHPLFIFLCS